MEPLARIALIGDLHGHWDDWDARYFSASDYALLLFTGDLGSGTRDNGVRIARTIARIDKPALLMPGNNDARSAPQIAAELGHQHGLRALLRLGMPDVQRSVAPTGVSLCGYSAHPLVLAGRELTLLAARPYARGGGELSFEAELRANHGIDSMAASTARLCALVDAATTRDLLVLAHNGPAGLGSAPTDLWGCDFQEPGGDFGDPDLRAMIDHARATDKRVLAVIAGHMHGPTRAGAARTVQRTCDGTLFVNPARVPRIVGDARGVLRHHVALELARERIVAREIAVREPD
jgi:uncharacterized protein (TIGR04168 family)